jgi:hypothetical protein
MFQLLAQFTKKSQHKNHKIGFEDVKTAIQNKKFIVINTLPETDQKCIIQSTINANTEEQIINDLILKDDDQTILIYGRNATDPTPSTKYDQLKKLGFDQVYVYVGGLFEWLLLQNIYGESEFPTTTQTKDLLQYRPPSTLS